MLFSRGETNLVDFPRRYSQIFLNRKLLTSGGGKFHLVENSPNKYDGKFHLVENSPNKYDGKFHLVENSPNKYDRKFHLVENSPNK